MKMAGVESAVRAVGMMQLFSDDCLLESSAPAPDGATHFGKEAVTRY